MITRAAFRGGSAAQTTTADFTVSLTLAVHWSITTDTTGRTIKLIDARKLTAGGPFWIANRGPDTLTLADFDGTPLATLTADTGAKLGLVENDTAAGTWTLVTRSLGYVDNPALTALGYAFGGRTVNSTTSDTLEWNPQLQTWTAKSDAPTFRSQMDCFTVSAAGYTCGIEPSSNPNNDRLDEYDPDVWVNRADMTQERREHQASAASNGFAETGVVFGGITNVPTPSSFFADTPIHYSQSGNAWSDGTDQPNGKIDAFAWKSTGVSIHVAGGRHTDGPNSFLLTHERYAVNTETWTDMQDLTWPERGNITGLATSSKGYVAVGPSVDGGANQFTHDDLHEYDPVFDSFTVKDPYPNGRTTEAGGVALADKLYVYGGLAQEEPPGTANPKSDYCGQYDPDTETWATQQAMPAARDRLHRSNTAIQS